MWILTNKTPKKVFLIFHKKFNKWQQPGGHIEQFENPVEAAIREIKEETGININFLKKQIQRVDKDGQFLPLPRFIMEQTIPKYKNCPEHFHLDIQFLIEIEEETKNSSKKDMGWFTKKEALKLSIHEDTRVAINKIM